MSTPNILISGSGIAGTVFAFWLLRAYPQAQITIVERSPSLRLTGASVDIRSSAVDVIQLMDLEAEIRANCTGEEGLQFVRSDGSPIATLGATGRTDIQSITSEFEIFRGALASIFMNPVKERITLLFSESVSFFSQNEGETENTVDVTFTNSKQTKTYDLLVAADGFASHIRGKMLGTDPRDQIRDEGLHVAYFTIHQDLLHSQYAKWHNDTHGRVVFLRPDPHPSGRTRANLMVVSSARDTERKARLDRALSEGNESFMRLMEELYQDAGWLSKEVLRGMREAEDLYCSIFAIVRSPILHSGRVVLLGDAGYATPGIGTSLAIVGGYVLAGELLRYPDDFETALKEYEALMQPYVRKDDGGGEQAMRYLNPQTWWGIRIRDAVLRVVGGLALDRLGLGLMAWMGWTEKKLAMPAYPWPAV
ncbi:hypothetical protein B0A55_00071 [Friedmanniomyces simplex]|uniref:FAD-binding domain-containing protein n=1 Tax=Friedmanniomyces simplex TaxID=329884 RepID=A0A4U0Y3R0_9PEZI|nr:hypothetical protein B0A55_00071 [Friedmanniomyces simplex]